MDVQRGMEPAKDLMRKSQMDVQMDQGKNIKSFRIWQRNTVGIKRYQIE